jgi:hypothetical protein
MAGFDAAWFDELRGVTDTRISVVQPAEFRPTVNELRIAGVIGVVFSQTAIRVLQLLYKTPYQFDRDFRVMERHIFTFPSGRAFRKQWNIGFYADDQPSGDCARIGIGFRLRRELTPEGIDDYSDFVARALSRPGDFDSLFAGLGNYVENIPATGGSLATALRSDTPDFDDDWRFFGKCLHASDSADRKILESEDLLAKEAVATFAKIQRAGFY